MRTKSFLVKSSIVEKKEDEGQNEDESLNMIKIMTVKENFFVGSLAHLAQI
jgi:hypothetical protein